MYSLLGNDGSIIAISTFCLLPDNQIPYDHNTLSDFEKNHDMNIEIDGGNDIVNTKMAYHLYVSSLLLSNERLQSVFDNELELFFAPHEPGFDHFNNDVDIEFFDNHGTCYSVKTSSDSDLVFACFYLLDNNDSIKEIKIGKVNETSDCLINVNLNNLYRYYEVDFTSREIFERVKNQFFHESVNEFNLA